MTNPRPTVLILDHSPEDTQRFQRTLGEDFRVLTAATGAQGRALIAAQPPDCVLLDYCLPDLTGLEFLSERDPAQVDAYAVIVLTDHAEIDLAIDCMKHGAHDVLTKGRIDSGDLRRAVTHGIENVALRRQLATRQREMERTLAALQASQARAQASEAQLRQQIVEASNAALEAERARLDERVSERTAALQASEAKLRLIYDLLPVGIAITDPAGQVVDCNQALEQFIGWKFALEGPGDGVWDWDIPSGRVFFSKGWKAMLGFTDTQIENRLEEWERRVHPQDLPRVLTAVQTHLAGTAPLYTSEHRMQCKDGSWKWVLDRGMVVSRDAAGQPLRAIGTHSDITERKQTETALRVLTERLQLATEAGGIGVWEWDVVTDRLIWDAQMYALYGVQEQAFGGAYAAWVQGLHPEDAAQAQASIARALLGEQTFRPEFRVRWPDGTVRHIAAFGKVMRDATGVAQRMVGVNWDITEARQARAAAEQAARVKSEFLAHMSHEIRTPMNAILGLSELALHQSLDPTSRGYLEHVHQSAKTLLGILNDILDQSKLESGHLSLDLVAFDHDELLERLRILFAPTAAAKGLALVITATPEVPSALLGAPLRLQQILTNLLSNALKFTHQGQIRLRVTRREAVGSGVRLRWAVTDTGIGMDAVTLDGLFDAFTQGDRSIARRFGGTGLGLSISRRLAQLMGGTLGVASEPGVGSTFTLDLRLDVAAGTRGLVVPPPPPAHTLAGARVLVVEDQPLNQRVIGDMLRLLGAQVTLAGDGGEALACLADGAFDAVLMDIQMPVMDGLTATRHIRANPAWGALPVIALTAGVTAAERAAITAAGLDDLLPKPVTLDALKTTLGRRLAAAVALEETPGLPQASGQASWEPAVADTLTGFDLSRLRQIAAGEDDVRALLHQFADAVRGDVDAITAALEAADADAAGQAAHRLKGLAATVGAQAVQEAAAHLEATLHAHAPHRVEALARLRECHTQALAQIAQLPTPAAPQPGGAVGNPEEARRLLDELRALVAQWRFVSPAVLTALWTALPASAQPTYQALVTALDQVDYPAAERLLAALAATAPAPGEPHA